MASQVAAKQSARTFELQRRKFALMAAEHVQALGERIRLRREELGMTQDEVARQMKGTVDGQRVSKWERGENRPRDESLEDLARVLKTTAVALLVTAPDKTETPDLSKPVALEGELAGILREIKEQLAEQNRVLQEIKDAVASEERARRDLLAATAAASQALRAGAPRPAEAPDSPAT